jgi:hypothetical protein
MASQINYDIIDGTYPVAGQDNSSQGFRDNFTNIKNNFESAYDEITDLQNKVILKSPLNNGIFDNNMQGNIITNAKTQGFRDLRFNRNNVSGSINVDFNTGSYQTLNLVGNTSISQFANFPTTTDTFTRIKVQFVVPSSSYTVTLPNSPTSDVNIDTDSIAGLDPSTNLLRFDGPGTYTYEFGTNDGINFNMIDLTNNRDTVPGGSFTITTGINGSATTGIAMTVTNIGGVAVGNITATNFFGNITTIGGASASFAGNVTAGNLIANTGIVGTLKTALQPNITQVGTLSSLSVTGNANVGNITVTGITDMCGGSMYGYQFVADAANGASTQIFSNVGWCVIAPNAVISTYTIIMPASPMDGQAIKISFANTITALTHTTGGASLKGGFATANANVGGEWIYHSASTTWYKAS